MICLAGLALALFVLAFATRGHEVGSRQLVERLAQERDPRVVTAAASVLASRGMHLTADALRARAAALSPSAHTAGLPPAPLPSQIPEASSAAWTAFVRAMAGSSSRADHGVRLGLFGIHLRRLAQLGCVTKVRGNATGGLSATWIEPTSRSAFLNDEPLQYRIFVASMRGLRIVLRRGHEPGEDIVDGQPASLSGLLAVAHHLGTGGLDAWLLSAAERERRRAASALFARTNGIF